MGVSSLPNDLASEVLNPEDMVKENFEIVASGWIAMQIQGPVASEDAVRFSQPRGHLYEIGGSRTRPQGVREGRNEFNGRL